MNWNGIIGGVSSAIGTVLPLVLNGLGKVSAGGPQKVGPAILYTGSEKDGSSELMLGNHYWASGASGPTAPVLITFASAEGSEQTTLSTQVAYGDSFPVSDWLAQFHDGDVSIGVSIPESSAVAGGTVEGIWTFVTSTILSVDKTVTAIVNPSLTLVFRLDASNNVVVITALGAATLLGMTYMLTARNNAGQVGASRGNLRITSGVGDAGYIMNLPAGIPYQEGIYDLNLQLPLTLNGGSVASDPRVKFKKIPQEVKDYFDRQSK